MDDLKKQAEELEIAIDGRWSNKRIQEEIDKVLAADTKPAEKKEIEVTSEKMFPVKLLRNYRPVSDKFQIVEGEGPREPTAEELAKVLATTTILLPVAEAQDIINKKIAERNDPIG